MFVSKPLTRASTVNGGCENSASLPQRCPILLLGIGSTSILCSVFFPKEVVASRMVFIPILMVVLCSVVAAQPQGYLVGSHQPPLLNHHSSIECACLLSALQYYCNCRFVASTSYRSEVRLCWPRIIIIICILLYLLFFIVFIVFSVDLFFL